VLPYWLLFSLCAAGALEHRRRFAAPFQGGPLLLTVGLCAAVMIGLRYDVGGDWETYLEIFEYMRFADLGENLFTFDPGFTILNWFAHQVGAGVWLINLICAAIFTWGLVRFARQQPNPWLVLVVAVPYLIIVVAMGYTRQAVAIGFLLAGFSILNRAHIGWFVFYVACAAAFHKSAVIVLPLVALATVQQRLLGTVLILVVSVLMYQIFLAGSVDRLVTNYVEAEYESQGAAIRVAMNLAPAVIFLTLSKRFQLSPVETKLWRVFSWVALGSLALLFLLASSTAVDRLALYLIPLQLFVLSRVPYAFAANGRPNGQIALLVIIYSATVQFVWLNYASHSEYWLPYQFYPLADTEDALGSS
jgi:hypothetical protein